MLDDTPEASLQNKFPDIGNAVAPAALLSRRAMPSQHYCSESALGSKGYDQPVVGVRGCHHPLCVSPGNCSVHWAATECRAVMNMMLALESDSLSDAVLCGGVINFLYSLESER